ncbi:MAG TPA: DsrE family protein [Phycisphaerae bacterium]|nr:DsrE family protein [Phycisphaerae bacterium]
MGTVLILNKDQMGHGSRELGEKILGACLRKLLDFPNLEAVVLYNSGVHLAVRGSALAADIHQLDEKGVDILACGSCVEYYGVQDRLVVDRISNMDEIVSALAKADKVITL